MAAAAAAAHEPPRGQPGRIKRTQGAQGKEGCGLAARAL